MDPHTFRLSKSTFYVNDLNKKILKLNKVFLSKYKTTKTLTTTNQSLCAFSIATGAATVGTAVTVVGLPVTVVTGILSTITGVTAAVLSVVGKRTQKSAIISRKQMAILQNAVHSINIILADNNGEDDKYQITPKEFKNITHIYNKALSDSNFKEMDDLQSISDFIANDILLN